jgi:putative nucleotidyltransferase with HDIG domain
MKKSQDIDHSRSRPAPAAPKTPTDSGRGPTDPGADRLRVLLVDDHAPVLRFLSAAFSSNGCLITAASTAEEALELIGQQSFDLVVSDIKMPGLSGLDVLQAVKGQQPRTPVVLITGVPTVDSAVFGIRHQAFDYLTKPFSVDEVQRLLERVRQERRAQEELTRNPAGAEELARRQFGMEVLSRIGALALQGLETPVFVETVLDYTIESLRAHAAVILLFDDDGDFTASQKGEAALAAQISSLTRASLSEIQKAGGHESLALGSETGPVAVLAALIPGAEKAMGVLCLGRTGGAAFLGDEKELLLAYARTIGVSLQKILLSENVEENLIDTISSFVNALESKDTYLKGHSARVSLYAGEIAKAMGLSPAQVAVARRAGILHDLGKLVVLDSILQKPGRLTNEEFALMMGHPVTAAKILKPLRFLAREAEAVKRHHERYDGKGYPDGLKGDDIPLIARIVTVADSFDAMTSDRPYRKALPIENALAEIRRHAGAQFDPLVTEALALVSGERLAEISRFYDSRSDAAVEHLPVSVTEAPTGSSPRELAIRDR